MIDKIQDKEEIVQDVVDLINDNAPERGEENEQSEEEAAEADAD